MQASKLANEDRKKAECIIKCKLLYVDNISLKEKITSFYMSLINDIQFLLKFSLDEDTVVFNYMHNKI
jgi:hypothetical protein